MQCASDIISGRTPRAVWVLVGSAFLGSFGLSVALRPHSTVALSSDSAEYHNLGVSIVQERSYAGTYRAPGYPALLSAVYAAAGSDSLLPVYAVQSLLLALTLLIVYRIALRISCSVRLSIAAVALCAIWPPIVLSAGDVMTETLSGLLVAVSLLLLMQAMEKPRVWTCLLLGIVLGAASLTKGAFLLFALAVPVLVALSGKSYRRQVVLAALTLVGIVITVSPWTYRNYRATGELVPVQTGAGMNFFLGNWPDYWKQRYEFGTYPPEVERALEGKSEIERERILVNRGLGYVREDPLRATGLLFRKFSYLWLGSLGADPRSSANPIPRIGNFGITKRSVVYTPLFLAAVVGWIALSRKERRRAGPMMWLLMLSSLPYVVTVAVPRYAVPMMYYQMILVAAAMRRVGAKHI